MQLRGNIKLKRDWRIFGHLEASYQNVSLILFKEKFKTDNFCIYQFFLRLCFPLYFSWFVRLAITNHGSKTNMQNNFTEKRMFLKSIQKMEMVISLDYFSTYSLLTSIYLNICAPNYQTHFGIHWLQIGREAHELRFLYLHLRCILLPR